MKEILYTLGSRFALLSPALGCDSPAWRAKRKQVEPPGPSNAWASGLQELQNARVHLVGGFPFKTRRQQMGA